MKRIGYLSLPLAFALQAAASGADPAPAWSGAPLPAAESTIEWGAPPAPPVAPSAATFHGASMTETLPGHGHLPLAPYAGCGDLGLNACCEREYSPLDGVWAGYCRERSHRHPISALCGALHIHPHRWGRCRAVHPDCACGGAAPTPAEFSFSPEAPLTYELAPAPVDANPSFEDPMEGLPPELAPPGAVKGTELPQVEDAGRGAGWLPLPRFNRLPL